MKVCVKASVDYYKSFKKIFNPRFHEVSMLSGKFFVIVNLKVFLFFFPTKLETTKVFYRRKEFHQAKAKRLTP